jgi:inosose dehydratase
MNPTRRQFLTTAATVTAATTLAKAMPLPSQNAPNRTVISANQYNWITFYGRQGKTWMADPDACLAEYAQTGLTAFEPAFNTADEVIKLAPYLKKYGLSMPSLYVGSALHRAEDGPKSIETILQIADVAKSLGTRIIVSNPSPIKWGGPENKTDTELITQAQNLNKLGGELRQRGLMLAYHTHDVELRAGAREFHHSLLATDPATVSLCLDAHWVYRGAGNSQVALFDVVKLYGKRIVEVHLRQSKNQIWTETFTADGDIDYPRLARELKTLGVKPQLVIEQCLEEKTPVVLGAIEAHKQDLKNVSVVFAGML